MKKAKRIITITLLVTMVLGGTSSFAKKPRIIETPLDVNTLKGVRTYTNKERIPGSDIVLMKNFKIEINKDWHADNSMVGIKNGRTMLPLRYICESLNTTVEWIPEKQEALIKKDGLEIIVTVGSNTAKVNGVNVKLDAPAEVVRDTTLIPVRFLAESLGLKVEWDGKYNKVIITGDVIGDW